MFETDLTLQLQSQLDPAMAQLIRIEILYGQMPGFGLTRAQWSARGGVEWN
jgi:hypothetical protein